MTALSSDYSAGQVMRFMVSSSVLGVSLFHETNLVRFGRGVNLFFREPFQNFRFVALVRDG